MFFFFFFIVRVCRSQDPQATVATNQHLNDHHLILNRKSRSFLPAKAGREGPI